VRAAAGTVDVAKAAVRSAELDLEFTRITAPMSGHVSTHQVSIGNLVFGGSGSTTLLTTIVTTDPIYCVFDVSEADLIAYQRAAASGKMALGPDKSLPVDGKLIDEPNWTMKGKLNFVENQVDRGSGTLRVRAVFANPSDRIISGQFAKLRLPASAPHEALLVPEEALVSDQSRKLVMSVSEDGTVVPHVVQLGPNQDGLVVVRDGIGPNDRIIIKGLMRSRPGAKVTPQPGTIETAPKQG
jgi:RND family efflux transporter MFP subunit